MKLLIVCQTIDSEHQNLGFFVRWVAEFAKHCSHITVIANSVGVFSLPDNVTVHSLGKENGTPRLRRYMRFFALIWKLRAEYDAVFVHMIVEYILAAGLFWRVFGKRILLWYVHGTVSWRLRLALLLSHGACTTNSASFRVKSSKVHAVGHGIDTEFFKPIEHMRSEGAPSEHEEYHIISHGRLSRAKRIEVVVDTVSMLKKEFGMKARLTIVGGPITDDDLAYTAWLHKKCEFLSWVSIVGPKNQLYVRDALQTADIMLNASMTGSVDKAVLEAMATGTLVVTSNEAFRGMLASFGLFSTKTDAPHLALVAHKALIDEHIASTRESLRAVIVKEHALPVCVERIMSHLHTPSYA
ncbi:MAG: glycosyltransferase family 4 protein [Patescibacteria group bacterium]